MKVQELMDVLKNYHPSLEVKLSWIDDDDGLCVRGIESSHLIHGPSGMCTGALGLRINPVKEDHYIKFTEEPTE